jgi:hypothetical protein
MRLSEKNKGTTDESIGRPGPWREGRYQRLGQPLEASVAPDRPLDSKRPIDAPGEPKAPSGPISTSVHLEEYTAPNAPDTKAPDSDKDGQS